MAVIHAAAALTVAGVLLAGCSTPSATETVDAPAATTASAECADFTNALDRTVTQFAYLKVAVGSDLDETERLGTLQEYTATMADGAAQCAPEAATGLATLRDQTSELATAYVPNADGAVAEGIYSILMGIRATGEATWTQMGRPIGGWAELPLHEDGSTIE